MRPPRRAADLRRGGHRLRPHRPDVRLRARGRRARLLLCLAKGITGGYLPLAATLATERIYEGFLGEHEEFRTFFHGHTYTGNPLACAAALATLGLFDQESTLERLQPKIELLADLLEPVAVLPAVAEVRQRGFMVGIELAGFPLEARMGHQVTLEARRRGAIVRPLGDVVVLMPPALDRSGRAACAGRDRGRGDTGGYGVGPRPAGSQLGGVSSAPGGRLVRGQ